MNTPEKLTCRRTCQVQSHHQNSKEAGMSKDISGQIGRKLEAYVDDMVIKSKMELDMIKDIEEMLLTLKKVNMKLNPKKCSFRIEEEKLLGYIVTSKGIRANPEKRKAIMNMPSLISQKQMQRLSANEAVSVVLLVERNGRQIPIHYLSRALQDGKNIWKLYTDEASNNHELGAGFTLIDPEGAEYNYTLRLNFANSNNDAEYEALLAGLRITAKMKVKKMHAYEARSDKTKKYRENVLEMVRVGNY
ncbi:reverse transcriptase domain-containing protein [Tanacetum coccineum]